jgi:DNA-binding NarL/FixJ family response regulator
MTKNPWGILIVCRSLHILPTARYVLGHLGYTNVQGTSVDGDGLIQVIQDIKPMITFLEADFFETSTPYRLGQLLQEKPYLKIAVYSLSAYPEDKEMQFVFHNAFGYINLQDGAAAFCRGLKKILRGEHYIPRRVRKKIDTLAAYPPYRVHDSKREDEVMELIWKGYKTRQIADLLNISVRTVERHKTNMYAHYHVQNCRELIKVGLELNKIKQIN